MTGYYEKQLKSISPKMAEKMISVGEYPMTKNMDKRSLGALMRVVSTIYNLEETITKS